MTLPLQGVKVVDFSRLLPGPFASMMLGDFGADIIRVEEPGAGSQPTGRRAELAQGAVLRGVFTSGEVARLRPYEAVGRNKKSIVLNLKHPQAQHIARELARSADVLLEEFRPGVAQRLGIDYETVSALNPRIIYCSVTLYGQNGPYMNHPGHDPCALGIAGVLSMEAEDEADPPRFAGLAIDDISSGLHAAIGILLALRARDLTGRGQWVDIGMLDAALDFQATTSAAHFRGQRVPKINRPNPAAGVWQCSDGQWLCTTNVEAHHWANFCRTIGHPELIPHQYDRERRAKMTELVRQLFLTRTRQEWLRLFWGEVESQAAPVHTIAETFEDPQVKARDMVLELDHPELGKVKQMGVSIKLSDTPGRFRSFSPPPGHHTGEVLAGLGYTPAQIEALRQEGAIG